MASTEATTLPTLLTLPTELRNAIYLYVFDPAYTSDDDNNDNPSSTPTSTDSLTAAFKFDNHTSYHAPIFHPAHSSSHLLPLLTCRQIHSEAHLLALSLTPFHLTSETTYPDLFDLRSRCLGPTKLASIRHLTLTARISNLRAMNEAWANLPFGHPSLNLETLTIVPRRPDCSTSAYAEVADLSQCHTLAYIFTETFKGLRKVRCVEVRNQGCFKDVVWRIVYRSLVYRLWRWGGSACGVRLEGSAEGDGEELGGGWFRAYLCGDQDGVGGDGGHRLGNEVGEEVFRLAGGEMPVGDTAGIP